MPETTSFLQDGVERVRDVYGSLGTELQRVQRDLRTRRKKIEKRLETGRKEIEKRFEAQRKQIGRRTQKIRSEIEKYPAVRRLETLRRDASKQFEQRVAGVLNRLQIASTADLERIDRKISVIHKQMKEMGRRKRTNGTPTTA